MSGSFESSVAQWIAEHRRRGGWTQAELGQKIGTSQAAISQWENEKGLPGGSDMRRLEEAFGECHDLEGHSRVLSHFASFGEITQDELVSLKISRRVQETWLDSMVTTRPDVLVASPLFFHLAGNAQRTHLWASFPGSVGAFYLGFELNLAEVLTLGREAQWYLWERFGRWRFDETRLSEVGSPADSRYLRLPVAEDATHASSELLDLYNELPKDIRRRLCRDQGVAEAQRQWTANVSGRRNLGILSRQLVTGVRRPLFLTEFELPEPRNDRIALKEISKSDVLRRSYVVAGLPLCTTKEYQHGSLRSAEIGARLLDHPLYALIVQFEIHRLIAPLSDLLAAELRVTSEKTYDVVLSGETRSLWEVCKELLIGLGFWPVTFSVNDSLWLSAVHAAIKNLERVGVLQESNGRLELAEAVASDVKAHPSRPQNRGEKPFRVRLLQFLETNLGGTA